MATQVQFRRGTTAQNASFTGALGEVTVDTDKDTLVVHDGGTAGGFEISRADASNLLFPDGAVGTPAISFASDTNTGIYRGGTDILKFVTAGTDAVTIDASQRLGIGTASPATPIHTYSTSSAINRFEVGSTSDSGIRVMNTAGDYSIYTAGGSLRFADNNGSERMRIDSSGNVGIGKSNPSVPLDVNGITRTTDAYSLSYAGVPGSTSAFGAGTISADANWGMYFKATTGSALADFAWVAGAGTERMRIDSSGNLLVGMTSPSNLTTGFSARANSLNSFCRDTATVDAAVLALNKKTGDGDILTIQKDGTTVGSIGTQGGTLEVGSGDVYLQFNGTNDWIKPVDGSGSNKPNVDLGTSGAKFKDLYLSGGVYLGGTGSANLLDDYEEGTFDAEIFDALSGGNQSSTSAIGYYTKIGEMVFFSFHLTGINITGLTSGNVAAFTLPFTSSSTTSKNYCAAVHVLAGDVNWAGSQTQISSFIGTSATRFQFFVQGDNESLEGVKVSEILSADFYISGQMRV